MAAAKPSDPDETDLASRIVRTIKSLMGIFDPQSSAQDRHPQPSDGKASPMLRVGFIFAGMALLALWGVSLMPAITNWNNPKEDGFSLVPAFWATLTALPLGLSATLGGISGRDKAIRRARIQLILAAGLLLLVAMIEVFRWMLILMDPVPTK